jgi:hypothetical protein
LHASIVFEDVFDNKLFSQQNKEKRRSKPAPDRLNQPVPKPSYCPFPALLPCRLIRVARSWGQGWP